MDNEWHNIPLYPNYEISKSGYIRNRYTQRLLKIHKYRDGYTYTRLRNSNNKPKNVKIHRLVAMTFIPNPENKPYIDHINRKRDDNRIENLRWCTPHENNTFPETLKAQRIAHKGVPQPLWVVAAKTKRFRELQGIKINRYSLNGTLIKSYSAMNEAAKEFGVRCQAIANACRGLRKTGHEYLGFIWEIA